ncbi:hypothetical protein A2U01_0026887, partial [Trifolium medium]|nr:hypothetical protein [Trifolium medium]
MNIIERPSRNMFINEEALGKAKSMNDNCRVLFKILISSILPREGGVDTISWEHKHFLYFLLSDHKINLADCLFEHLCGAIKDSTNKRIATAAQPRLLSELFYQCKFVRVLKKLYPNLVKEERANKLDAYIVSEADVEEAIRNYLHIVKEDTRVESPRKKRKRVVIRKSVKESTSEAAKKIKCEKIGSKGIKVDAFESRTKRKNGKALT